MWVGGGAGGNNFLISNSFLMILSASDAPKEGIQACLDPKSNEAYPLDPACPERLSVCSPIILP